MLARSIVVLGGLLLFALGSYSTAGGSIYRRVRAYNGKIYRVLARYPHRTEAADALARTESAVHIMIGKIRRFGGARAGGGHAFRGHVITPYVDTLLEKHGGDSLNIREFTPTDPSMIAFNYDKGKEIGICLRDPKTGAVEKDNRIIGAVLHELAHSMTPVEEESHGDVWAENYDFLKHMAAESGVYSPLLDDGRLCGE